MRVLLVPGLKVANWGFGFKGLLGYWGRTATYS